MLKESVLTPPARPTGPSGRMPQSEALGCSFGDIQFNFADQTIEQVRETMKALTTYLGRHGKEWDEGAVGGAEWIISEVQVVLNGVRFPDSPLEPSSRYRQ
jgi:hypothetical protein